MPRPLARRAPRADKGHTKSVLQSKRDDDVGRFGLVYLQTRLASSLQLARFTTMADSPAASTGSTMLSPRRSSKKVCSPNRSLSCRNQGMVIGNGAGFELVQGSFELCRVEFHCASFRSLGDVPIALCGASHHEVSNANRVVQMQSSVIPRGVRKLSSRTVQ